MYQFALSYAETGTKMDKVWSMFSSNVLEVVVRELPPNMRCVMNHVAGSIPGGASNCMAAHNSTDYMDAANATRESREPEAPKDEGGMNRMIFDTAFVIALGKKGGVATMPSMEDCQNEAAFASWTARQVASLSSPSS